MNLDDNNLDRINSLDLTTLEPPSILGRYDSPASPKAKLKILERSGVSA